MARTTAAAEAAGEQCLCLSPELASRHTAGPLLAAGQAGLAVTGAGERLQQPQ